mgnify:CR=1 FL=1
MHNKPSKRDKLFDELKDFRADAFQLLTPDQAVAAMCWLAAFALIFAPWLK